MAVCELVQSVALQVADREAAGSVGAIDEPDWSPEEACRLVALERELTRRWIEAAELAEASTRESADGGARDRPV